MILNLCQYQQKLKIQKKKKKKKKKKICKIPRELHFQTQQAFWISCTKFQYM